MDREARCAAVHGVAKDATERLSCAVDRSDGFLSAPTRQWTLGSGEWESKIPPHFSLKPDDGSHTPYQQDPQWGRFEVSSLLPQLSGERGKPCGHTSKPHQLTVLLLHPLAPGNPSRVHDGAVFFGRKATWLINRSLTLHCVKDARLARWGSSPGCTAGPVRCSTGTNVCSQPYTVSGKFLRIHQKVRCRVYGKMAVMLEIHFKYSVKVREKMVMKVTSAIENKCILVRHYYI